MESVYGLFEKKEMERYGDSFIIENITSKKHIFEGILQF